MAQAETSSDPVPWWKSGTWVGGMAALIAAVMPATTFIRESITKERELALAEREEDYKIRTAYLDRAVDTEHRTPEGRQQILRFLAATDDRSLTTWAKEELKRVDEQVEEVRKARSEKQA